MCTHVRFVGTRKRGILENDRSKKLKYHWASLENCRRVIDNVANPFALVCLGSSLLSMNFLRSL